MHISLNLKWDCKLATVPPFCDAIFNKTLKNWQMTKVHFK